MLAEAHVPTHATPFKQTDCQLRESSINQKPGVSAFFVIFQPRMRRSSASTWGRYDIQHDQSRVVVFVPVFYCASLHEGTALLIFPVLFSLPPFPECAPTYKFVLNVKRVVGGFRVGVWLYSKCL